MSSRVVRRVSQRLLISLIMVEAIILLIYLGSIRATGVAYSSFDFNGQATVPSLLQALHFLAIALIILWILGQRYFHQISIQKSGSYSPQKLFSRAKPLIQIPSSTFLITFAVLVLYAAVDEVFKIHLQLHRLLAGQNWKWLYLSLFVGVMAWHCRSFIQLWRYARQETYLVFLGIAIFVLGGYGSEILKDILLNAGSYQSIEYETFLGLPIENLRIAYEELSELIGENLILYACLQFVGKRLELEKVV
ncbi:MAG: hypothetical protein HC840_32000 [Leptolyngbyaceae cyanobacterium RM2_2_4]|nr:hypothetical protein [Leptolyngbyaceae cyanobacterium SM1_4_3]NJN89277.1 hypothetical protein [Leptolyngbyaceae cyanobacterium SL_5_14]NJO53265.1 hypothetical protein [Leptolyngbyaceae cyanobacterium RM2_2_4]